MTYRKVACKIGKGEMQSKSSTYCVNEHMIMCKRRRENPSVKRPDRPVAPE